MTRRLVVCVFGVFLLGVVWAVVPAGGAVDGGTAGFLQPQTTPDEFDDTAFRLRIYENRSVRWTAVYSRPLENQSEVESFETFAAEFNANETALFRNFESRARTLVSIGENATGRSMNATAFSRRAERNELGTRTRGIVEMSFLWTNFARSEGDRVIVADLFQGGMYVAEGQSLEFQRGPGVAFVAVEPSPDSSSTPGNLTASDSVTWFGEMQFADRRPFLELAPREAVAAADGADPTATRSSTATGRTATTAAPAGQDGSGQDGSGDDGSGIQLAVVLAGVIVLAVLAVGFAWYADLMPPLVGGSDASTGPAAGGNGATVGPASPGGSGMGVPQEELLSDEDRVERLLENNGGRMKQVHIVEETEWSKSKVSMLLSEMEDDGRISKLRVGRENIISIAGQEPEAAGSPFEEE